MSPNEDKLPQHAMSLTWEFLSNILSNDKRFENMTVKEFRETWGGKKIDLNKEPHWIFNHQFLISTLYTACLVSKEKEQSSKQLNILLSEILDIKKIYHNGNVLRHVRNSLAHYRIHFSKDMYSITFKDEWNNECNFEATTDFNKLKAMIGEWIKHIRS